MRSGEEIQKALEDFVGRWSGFQGSERAEAQTFLNQLFECFGSDRGALGAKFEDFKTSAGFMDLHWPGVCIVEMKAPDKVLDAARVQVKRYWEESADDEADIPAARWVLICNFRKFEVWEPGRFPKYARAAFDLGDLPQRYEALTFLAGPEQVPSFVEHYKQLTSAAAESVASVYQSLIDRSAAPPDEITRFTMQAVWAMFAEDLDLLQGFPFQRTVERLRKDPSRSSAAEIGFLFRVLNQKGNHNRKDLLVGTRYVNGQLFADPAEVDLNTFELDSLAVAAEYDWSKVDPTIFGSLMEGVIGRERRWELGAHYTHESDIMKIVGPSVVRPWQDKIDNAASPMGALAVLEELCQFRVLDPACGCGNFLYVAYREMRGLEFQLREKINELASATGQPLPPTPWPYVPLTNFLGIDVEPVAVLIARVTLWMGHRQMIDKYGPAEDPLPLISLSGITIGDAVFGRWPTADCIVGNPPFMGDRRIRRALGGGYVEKLKRGFPGIGVVDYSAYWFRRAHEHLKDGQRAGLVSTNTLRENKHRNASLGYISKNGGVITDAVSSQRWPGEAKVHVSITNWAKRPSGPITYSLDGFPVDGITPQLRAGETPPDPRVLSANGGKSFIGCQPTGPGFILDEAEAQDLIAAGEGDVVRPYLISDDITEAIATRPSRWIIDFATLPLEQALKYRKSLAIVRQRVKPDRVDKNERHFGRLWWQFAWPRPVMRKALIGFDRFIVCTLTGKRFLVSWADSSWCPSNLVGVFALDQDYHMGVLGSRAHRAWAWLQSSSFETRLRYTPSTAFETFPWPVPTDAQRAEVAYLSKRLHRLRDEISIEASIGLTTLYNLIDEGAYVDLQKLHLGLDEAVAECYGLSKRSAQDDLAWEVHLGRLNAKIAQDSSFYAPFATDS